MTRRCAPAVATTCASSNAVVSTGLSDVPFAVAVFPSTPSMKERTAICSSRARPSVFSSRTPSARGFETVEDSEYTRWSIRAPPTA